MSLLDKYIVDFKVQAYHNGDFTIITSCTRPGTTLQTAPQIQEKEQPLISERK